MLKRLQYVNIPTDVLRTVVTIVDMGSFGKAGERLGLSQPAISAQIKRLQVLVGGAIFARTAGGVSLNVRGKTLLPIVRDMLASNDKILQIGGSAQDPRPIRVGMTFLYGSRFLAENPPDRLQRLNIVCDHSQDLLRSISEGYLDVCAVFEPTSRAGEVLNTWNEKIVWVRGPDFTLSPGAPVPLVGWPGMIGDQIAMQLLDSKGISYRFACTSNESTCRIDAVAAGLGVMLVPEWSIPAGLVEAKEYYLPPVPLVEAGIVKSNNVDLDSLKHVLQMLSIFDRGGVKDKNSGANGKKHRSQDHNQHL